MDVQILSWAIITVQHVQADGTSIHLISAVCLQIIKSIERTIALDDEFVVHLQWFCIA